MSGLLHSQLLPHLDSGHPASSRGRGGHKGACGCGSVRLVRRWASCIRATPSAESRHAYCPIGRTARQSIILPVTASAASSHTQRRRIDNEKC